MLNLKSQIDLCKNIVKFDYIFKQNWFNNVISSVITIFESFKCKICHLIDIIFK